MKQSKEWIKKRIESYKKNFIRIESKCDNCKKNISQTLKSFKSSKNHFCNRKCYYQYKKINQMGKNNPNYKNGISPYTSRFINELTKKIRKRDNYTCQYCGIKQSQLKFKIKLGVHHKNFNKKDDREKNLITICQSCHVGLHNGRRN